MDRYPRMDRHQSMCIYQMYGHLRMDTHQEIMYFFVGIYQIEVLSMILETNILEY